MNALTSTFNGDMKPAPGPKDGAKEWNQASSLNCSPATLDTPYDEGVFSYHKADQMLGVTTMVDLPHGAANLSSPFESDFRPGVDSSKS